MTYTPHLTFVTSYKGYNILALGQLFYAVHQSIGEVDERFLRTVENDAILSSSSISRLKTEIDHV